jgi:CubicO group peptidase (beta-lactamase class C family)
MKKAMTALLLAALMTLPTASAQDKGGPAINIHLAALQGNVQAIQQHIEAGSDLNQKDAYGSTPLTIAATFGRTAVARALIDAGAGTEVRDGYGSTPLHTAAFLCRTEIVRALLNKGADRYARNNFGSTALESVAAPFEDVRSAYDRIGTALAPVGLTMDYEQIRNARPEIMDMLRPRPDELAGVRFTPLRRNDWEVSTPEKEGLDSKLVAELYFDAGHSNTLFGLLVIANGRLIAEKYFNGASIDKNTLVASVTKSFTSALTGIAVDQGALSSVDEKMVGFFPEFTGKRYDPRKDRITLRHMLQMRAGFPWEETDPAYWDSLLTGDYVPMIVDFPLVNDPGSGFNYSNLTSNWLGILLARACRTDLKSFAQKTLFGPLGIEPGNWKQDWDGYYIGCGDLELKAREMAKFGLMYLNGGEFDGKQIVPSEWVKASLQDYSKDAWITKDRTSRIGPFIRDLGYGYQWWSATVGSRRVDFAWGHGGQLIVLLHDLDMVVVMTSDPQYMKHDEEAWRYEKMNLNLVGKFIQLLPER